MRKQLMHFFVCVIVCSFVFGPASLSAQGNGQGHGKGRKVQSAEGDDQDRERDDARPTYGRPVFTARDRDIIRGYFRNQSDYSNLPPGLAKRGGNLPPGLQKHLERNGQLPPGLQKRLQPMPPEIEVRLPRLPDVYHRVILGPDVLIYNSKTQRVLDIIHDVVYGPYR